MTEHIKNQIVTYFINKAHVFPVKNKPYEEVSVKVTDIEITSRRLYFDTVIYSPTEVFLLHNSGMENLVFHYFKIILKTYFSCYEPINVQISTKSGGLLIKDPVHKSKKIINLNTERPHQEL